MIKQTNPAARRIVENGKRAGERKFKRDCIPSTWIRSWYATLKEGLTDPAVDVPE